MSKARQDKTLNSEYERAFTELASFLYEQYRIKKRQQQIEKSDDASEEEKGV